MVPVVVMGRETSARRGREAESGRRKREAAAHNELALGIEGVVEDEVACVALDGPQVSV